MLRRLLDTRTVTLGIFAAGLFFTYREVRRARLVAEQLASSA